MTPLPPDRPVTCVVCLRQIPVHDLSPIAYRQRPRYDFCPGCRHGSPEPIRPNHRTVRYISGHPQLDFYDQLLRVTIPSLLDIPETDQ